MRSVTLDELLPAAATGQRVLLAVSSWSTIRPTLDRLRATIADQAGWTVRLAHGQERISHSSGGFVCIVCVNGNGYRGVTADLLVLDGPVPHQEDLWPVVAPVNGEIVSLA